MQPCNPWGVCHGAEPLHLYTPDAVSCIKWNVGTCQVQASRHDSPDKSDSQQVRHICGGCWFLGKVEDESHSMKTCKKKNAQGLFQ